MAKKFNRVMGSKPIHVMTPEERTKVPKTTDYFIDLGMSSGKIHLCWRFHYS